MPAVEAPPIVPHRRRKAVVVEQRIHGRGELLRVRVVQAGVAAQTLPDEHVAVGVGQHGPAKRPRLQRNHRQTLEIRRHHQHGGRGNEVELIGVGNEPDPRFTFANERTFLAWVRTSLALIAAGVSLDTFITKFPVQLRVIVAIGLVLTGSCCGAMAYRRWMASERALRVGDPLPAPKIAPTLAYGVALTGLIVAAVLLVRP